MDYIDDLYHRLFEAFNAKYGDCEAKVKAILRESFPDHISDAGEKVQAEASGGRYAPACPFAEKTPLSNGKAWCSIEGHCLDCPYGAHELLESIPRPAPTAEKALRDALGNCVRWMVEHGCSHEYAVLKQARALLAREEPKDLGQGVSDQHPSFFDGSAKLEAPKE